MNFFSSKVSLEALDPYDVFEPELSEFWPIEFVYLPCLESDSICSYLLYRIEDAYSASLYDLSRAYL